MAEEYDFEEITIGGTEEITQVSFMEGLENFGYNVGINPETGEIVAVSDFAVGVDITLKKNQGSTTSPANYMVIKQDSFSVPKVGNAEGMDEYLYVDIESIIVDKEI